MSIKYNININILMKIIILMCNIMSIKSNDILCLLIMKWLLVI